MNRYRKYLISLILLLALASILAAVMDMTRPLTGKTVSIAPSLATYTPTVTATTGWWMTIPTQITTPTTKGGNEKNP